MEHLYVTHPLTLPVAFNQRYIVLFSILSSYIDIFFFSQVQNAVEYLKTIGALDENENLTVLGRCQILANF